LLAPWLPFERPLLLLLAQAAMGAVCYLCARLPDFQRFFMRERRATEMAQEQALQEFFRYGLHETAERTGVLLFVSLLEHRVVVLADQGIDARVDPDRWIKTTTLVLTGIQRDDLRGGIVDGIQSIADVLALHFPWAEGDRDEIPNRVIVRRE
jgi:putative membrane protein